MHLSQNTEVLGLNAEHASRECTALHKEILDFPCAEIKAEIPIFSNDTLVPFDAYMNILRYPTQFSVQALHLLLPRPLRQFAILAYSML